MPAHTLHFYLCIIFNIFFYAYHLSIFYFSFFFLIIPPPPRSTLFPYTTLFRSVKPWCFKQQPRSWRRRTPPSQSTSLPTLRWPSSTACIASRSGSTPTSERRPAVSSWKPPSDRKSTRLNSSHSQISYAVFCLKK